MMDIYLKYIKQLLKVAFEYNNKYKKFQTPENWLIQVAKIGNLDWPPSPEVMDSYELGTSLQENKDHLKEYFGK